MLSDASARERMVRTFGRVATPVIVIGRRVFWGFADNRQDIADLLGVPQGEPPEGTRDDSADDVREPAS